MKSVALRTLVLLAAVPGAVLVAQAPGAAPQGGKVEINPYDDPGYDAGALNNETFVVRNISFNNRFRMDGRGQVLDVIFDLENLTELDLNLSYAVLAVHETDSVDKRTRQLVPYPTWRGKDFEKEALRINHSVSSPVELTPEEVAAIWKEKIEQDDALCKSAKNPAEQCAFQKNRAETYLKRFKPYPELWRMADYLAKNYSKFGKKFILSGINAPKMANPAEPWETLDKDGREIGKIVHARLKATVISSHESRFRPNFHHFNKVVILVFEPGSGKVLYRKFMEFKREKRIL